jgi:hypothetical protein
MTWVYIVHGFYFIACRTWQIYPIESLLSPEHALTATMLNIAITVTHGVVLISRTVMWNVCVCVLRDDVKNRCLWSTSYCFLNGQLTQHFLTPCIYIYTVVLTILWISFKHLLSSFLGEWQGLYVRWKLFKTIGVAVRSTAWVCGRSLTGIVGSNPAGGMDVCLLWVLCVVR